MYQTNMNEMGDTKQRWNLKQKRNIFIEKAQSSSEDANLAQARCCQLKRLVGAFLPLQLIFYYQFLRIHLLDFQPW